MSTLLYLSIPIYPSRLDLSAANDELLMRDGDPIYVEYPLRPFSINDCQIHCHNERGPGSPVWGNSSLDRC